MYSDFDSWFEEVRNIGDECGQYIDNASDFEHFHKSGMSPDEAYDNWVIDKGK